MVGSWRSFLGVCLVLALTACGSTSATGTTSASSKSSAASSSGAASTSAAVATSAGGQTPPQPSLPTPGSGSGGATKPSVTTSATSSAVAATTATQVLNNEQLLQALTPSTVMIRAVFPATPVSDQGEGSGTGIVYTQDGYIITNAHVVEGAAVITVAAAGSTKQRPARFVGVSSCDDLAVIKIDDMSGLKPATLGSSAVLKGGQEIAAIGYPLGDTFGTSPVIVSGLVSRTDVQVGQYESLVQTSAPINPGNSGGPLVDSYGQVVGINALKVNPTVASNTSFAISIDQAKPVVQVLQQGHNQLWIGMNLTSNNYAKYFGMTADNVTGEVVEGVDSGGPAEHVNVQPAYLLLKLAGLPVSSPAAVCGVLRSHNDGDALKVEFLRVTKTTSDGTAGVEGQILQGDVTIGKASGGTPLTVVQTVALGAVASATASSSANTTASGSATGNANTSNYDFQADNGDWYTGTTDAQTVTLGGGTYAVTLKQPNIHGVYFPKSMPGGGDQGIAANVAVTSTDGVAGVATRFVNNNGKWSFYLCAISPGGQFGCFVVVDGTYTTLVKWTASSAIHSGQMNALTLITEGTKLTFSINGTQMVSLNDTRLSSGYPGLYVESFDKVPIAAKFGKVTAEVVK